MLEPRGPAVRGAEPGAPLWLTSYWHRTPFSGADVHSVRAQRRVHSTNSPLQLNLSRFTENGTAVAQDSPGTVPSTLGDVGRVCLRSLAVKVWPWAQWIQVRISPPLWSYGTQPGFLTSLGRAVPTLGDVKGMDGEKSTDSYLWDRQANPSPGSGVFTVSVFRQASFLPGPFVVTLCSLVFIPGLKSRKGFGLPFVHREPEVRGYTAGQRQGQKTKLLPVS